ncbi:MAG TPA: alanine--glyoxylate aminotransferase family protein [Polyangiales bacterium]|nr:alanine--glyoxylate aminotransferase family protein [Polyangiales bacterium]
MSTPVPPPPTTPLSAILPPEPLLLMGAGPVPIPQAVAQANGMIINHLGPTMDRVIRNVKQMAAYAFQTRSDKILGLAGPASAAMEMAVANLCWPGRRVLCLSNGTFSGRLGEMAQGVGADVTMLEGPPGKPISLQQVKDAFARGGRYDVVTMAHGETSCGVKTVELPEICKFAKEQGALTIVDSVVTLTAMPVSMDEWGIDVGLTGGQKALSSIPGVSLIAFSTDAWRVVEKHPTPCPHWCYDAQRAQRFWGEQQYHYTAPVPGVLALHEALRLVAEETLEKRFRRHEMSSLALQAGLEAMGLTLYAPPEVRLNSVIAVHLPDAVDSGRVREYMTKAFRVEISGAFGLNIVRIGQMGEQCRSHNLFKTLYALGMSFAREGAKLNVAAGMAALEAGLAGDRECFVD